MESLNNLESGLAMVRGMRVFRVLGLTGLLLFLGSGPTGEPCPDLSGGRVFSQPANPAPVALKAAAAHEVGSHASQPAKCFRPEDARQHPGEFPRLPAQIANLVKSRNLARVIEKYAQHYGVDQDLVWAVIRQESGFNPQAVSPKGAMGLMQLMPGTAALMGVSDAFDVEQNIAGGVKYLDRCLSQFNQDVGLALAAYNAGPDNVVKYQGCPPFSETRQYVMSVLKAYGGESMREDWERLGFSPVREEVVPGPESPKGLTWRVLRPQWRIATPQCKLGAPRWKMPLLPF